MQKQAKAPIKGVLSAFFVARASVGNVSGRDSI